MGVFLTDCSVNCYNVTDVLLMLLGSKFTFPIFIRQLDQFCFHLMSTTPSWFAFEFSAGIKRYKNKPGMLNVAI